jgi:hypothetical protein
MKILRLIAFIILPISTFYGQIMSGRDSLCPKTLRQVMKSDSSKIRCDLYLNYLNFNFNNFSYSKLVSSDSLSVNNKLSYYRVGFDNKKNIGEINYYKKGVEIYKLSRLKAEINSRSFVFLMFKRNFSDNGFKNVGFFINIDSLGYCIHYSHYNNNNSILGMDYVMYLDSNLNVVSFCKLNRGTLSYLGGINYDKSGSVKNVSLYTPNFCHKIEEKSLFKELQTFNKKATKLYEVGSEIGTVQTEIKNENLQYPFWLWAGEHGYK